MNLENLKSELGKTGYANLFVENGQNIDFVEGVKRKFNIPQDTAIIGFIDSDYEQKGEEGVLITGEGIRWVFSQVKIDENDQAKGSLTFAQLANYSCQAKTKFIRNGVTLTKQDIGDGKNLAVEMSFLYNVALDDKAQEEQVRALEKVFAILSSVAVGESAAISDEKNGELIEAFIGDKDQSIFYKKAFGKYSLNGVEKFAFCFSWGGFIFGSLNLFHRKLYLEGVIWLIGSALLSGISAGFLAILIFFAGAFVNPFLVFKRYKKILLQCDSQKLTYDQKLETIRTMGGTNTATTVIFGLAVLIGFIVFVVVMFRSC